MLRTLHNDESAAEAAHAARQSSNVVAAVLQQFQGPNATSFCDQHHTKELTDELVLVRAEIDVRLQGERNNAICRTVSR